MSQAGQYNLILSSAIETLTGDNGGPVGPTGGNVDLVGDGTIITVVGTPASSLLTITPSDTLATTYDADVGSATPASNTLTIAGGTNIATTGAGSTVTIDFDGTLPVASGGTGDITLTDHGVLLGSGTSPVTVTAAGTDGQVLIGATAADPAFATITSTGSTITFTPGTNSLNMETGDSVSTSFPTDGGTATPSSGSLTIAGGTNIATSGAGSTVTIDFDGTLPVASGGTGNTSFTEYAVVCGGTSTTNPLQSIASVGTSGQVLTSNGAASLPTFQDASGYLTWNVETTTSATLVSGNGYFANNAGTVTFTLPATASVGDIFAVYGMNNATGWAIAQNAGQSIHFGTSDTTIGAGGSLASTNTYDGVVFVCNVTDTEFVVIQSIGNITIV